MKPEEVPPIGLFLYDSPPGLVHAFLAALDITDLAVYHPQLSDFDMEYLFAHLTKSEILRLNSEIRRMKDFSHSPEEIKEAENNIRQAIAAAMESVPEDMAQPPAFDELNLSEEIPLLAAEPDDPERVINFLLSALVHARREGLIGLEGWEEPLKRHGLEAFWHCLDPAIEGVEPFDAAKQVRLHCDQMSVPIKLLMIEGIHSLQLGLNPEILYARLYCVMRELEDTA